jgi:hypothetical protein
MQPVSTSELVTFAHELGEIRPGEGKSNLKVCNLDQIPELKVL